MPAVKKVKEGKEVISEKRFWEEVKEWVRTNERRQLRQSEERDPQIFFQWYAERLKEKYDVKGAKKAKKT